MKTKTIIKLVMHFFIVERDVTNPADRILFDGAGMGLVNKAFALCFKEARLATTAGSEIEHKKNVGQVPTFMRILITKGRNLLSHFDKNIGSEAGITETSIKPLHIKNHNEAASRRKLNGHLAPEHISGTSEKLPNNWDLI